MEVVLINNQSSDPATMSGLTAWLDQPRRSAFAVVEHEGPFNYARMHNRVIADRGGDRDLLLFLNNDVELVSSDCFQTLAMHLLAVSGSAFAGIRLEFPDGGGIQHGGIKIDESRLTCGCYPFLHASEPTDYVYEERAVFAVTFACAMVRRSVLDRLGALDEVLLPNSYGDVDIQARALEMGFRNYYYGTLFGTHYESKTRRRVPEECEFLALHQRHAQVISDWKAPRVQSLPANLGGTARTDTSRRHRTEPSGSLSDGPGGRRAAACPAPLQSGRPAESCSQAVPGSGPWRAQGACPPVAAMGSRRGQTTRFCSAEQADVSSPAPAGVGCARGIEEGKRTRERPGWLALTPPQPSDTNRTTAPGAALAALPR